jgi:hypothetical protein
MQFLTLASVKGLTAFPGSKHFKMPRKTTHRYNTSATSDTKLTDTSRASAPGAIYT